MRIGIDASTVGTLGGPRIYVLNLIRSLLEIDRQNEYVIFYGHRRHLGTFPQANEVVVRFSNPVFRLLREWLLLPLFYQRERLDLVHNPKSAVSFLRPCRTVVTLHDLIPLKHPETESPLARVYWRIQIPIAARFAHRIVTDSEYSRNEIMGRFGISEPRIETVHLGKAPAFNPACDRTEVERVIERYDLPERYLLSVGTIQPRKNLETLMRAFSSLKSQGRLEHRLVIVGREGWLRGSLTKLTDSLGLNVRRPGAPGTLIQPSHDVILTGWVPDEDLPFIYNGAHLFVYPSRFEGFGMPPLEAMSCGVPVIVSNRSSLPEVVDRAGIMVDPEDQRGLEEAILKVLTDERLRRSLIERGLEQARKFSWEKTARRMLRVYEEVAKQ